MYKLTVKSHRGEYTVSFINNFLNSFNQIYKKGDLLILDQKIFKLYPYFFNKLNDKFLILIKANENSKEFNNVQVFIKKIIKLGFKKKNKFIVIGGGTVQDLASFSASILFRGTKWVYYPTTLESQCDSCIGSKTSINFAKTKNLLGSFFPPDKVFICKHFLKTLTLNEIFSGIGEMMHYYLTSKKKFYLIKKFVKEKIINNSNFDKLIFNSLKIKKKIIEVDEFDVNKRKIFNYGHTFGHALEAVTNFKISHGIAVSYGLDIANYISFKKNKLNKLHRNNYQKILSKIYKDFPLPKININKYIKLLKNDKKSEGKKINIIILIKPWVLKVIKIKLDKQFINLLSSYFKNKIYNKLI